MNIKQIQEEIEKIQSSPFSRKTDKQLASYEMMSQLLKNKYQGKQPSSLVIFNKSENRKTKLKKEDVREIRRKYNPHIYGKKKLAKEYGVSATLIYKIIKNLKWRKF